VGILGRETLRRKHGLPGLFSLTFDTFADELFRREDGERVRMQDLAISCATVVAGVRKQSFDRLPRRFRHAAMATLQLHTLPFLRIGIGPVVAARLWQVAAFIDSRVVKPIIVGGAASNVPVELAWKRVQDGRLGTRNACYFAWDCFHPQWDPKHLWQTSSAPTTSRTEHQPPGPSQRSPARRNT
jgi:hypothetical protein